MRQPRSQIAFSIVSGVLAGYRGVVLVALLVATLPVQAQPPELQRQNPAGKPVAPFPAQKRREPITRPVSLEERIRLPLIGFYRFTTGFSGKELHLLQNGTYSLESSGDIVNLDDWTNEAGKSFGTWSVRQDEAVVLTPTDAARKKRLLTAPLTLYPIGWGPRRYLLEGSEFASFQKDAAAGYGREARKFLYGSYLLRDGDRLKSVRSMPLFPARWRSLLPVGDPPATSVPKP